MLYNWIKAAHVIFVIATMAGLMIYPVKSPSGSSSYK